MKKLIRISAGAAAAALLLGSAVTASAQTSSTTATTSVAQISALLQQVKTLQEQLANLQKQQGQAMTQLVDVLQMTRQLRLGMSGEDVTALQKLLAEDPEVYPEGLVTGYYGSLTEKAIKKFQKKHGFESVGNVGPKTLKKLNELLSNKGQGKKLDVWNAYASTTASTTKGWGEVKLSVCHKGKETLTLPLPAITAHLGHGDKIGACGTGTITPPPATTTPTTTPDTIAPILSNITASSTSATTTDIKWSTNENANGALWYGTSSPVSVVGQANMSVSALTGSHLFNLGNLATSTTYYYVVGSTDASGNTATSSTQSFVTPAQ